MRRPPLVGPVTAVRARRSGPRGTAAAGTVAGDQPDPADADGPAADVSEPPAPRGVPAGREVELPGRGTTFVRELPGPPGAPALVLLHGWTATGGVNWCTSFEALGRRYRVVAIDHRGHGRGIRSDRRFRLEDCADDAVALADALGLDTFVPVGYSMGGPIAQLVWRRHRDRVDALVLCATSRNFRGRPIERAFFPLLVGLSAAARVTPEPWRATVGRRVLTRRATDDARFTRWARSEIGRNDPAAILEAGQAIGSFSSRDWIGEVDVPTAVVTTELDGVVPPRRQHKLADAIPGASVHPVAADHGGVVLAADRFLPQLLAACRRVTAT